MARIFPPVGEQDQSRARKMKADEREYLWFCLQFCDKVLKRRATHIEALELAANHFTELGYYQDGLRLDERLAELLPSSPGILYNLSCSLALTGRIDEALDILARAIDSGYRDFQHMSTDRDLSALHNDPRFGELLAMAGNTDIAGT